MDGLTDFCDLPNHKNEEVYVRGVYSGVEEYWGVTAFEVKCNTTIPGIELDIPDEVYSEINSRVRSNLDSVKKHYQNRYAVIDMIGVYDDSNPNGYGHLGHNKARFIVKHIVDVQVVLKKNKL